ncbi:MAG: response regulator [Calditrichaeota bacterium]|nr:MAG: response regulator [Calditrichota bacterium]
MSTHTYYALLIENKKSDFIITKDILQDLDVTFELKRVTDYQKGLEAYQDQQYDLCLLDFQIDTDHTAINFLEESAAKFCMTPVIVLTRTADRETDLQVMAAGASDYMVKGQINGSLLERSLRYAIERKKNQQQLMDLQDELTLALKEIRANQKKLIEVENLKSVRELAGAVAHEFSQPLQALSNYMELVRSGISAEKYLDKMDDMVQRIAQLTDNLRDITGLSKKSYLDTHILEIQKQNKPAREAALNILLVDDEQIIVETISEMLRVSDIPNTAVTNPLRALELLKTHTFSHIISDVSMPELSGPQFYEQVRAMGIETPFIFLTGYEVEDQLRHIAGDNTPILGKPVDIRKLIDSIKELEAVA